MDNEAVFADDNTVLYGHNMKNGSMFHDLTLYRSRSFMATHPYIYLYTPEGAYELRIYAVRIAADNDVRSFTLGEKYETYVSRVQDAALFTGTFTPQRGTKLLTLSTCTYDFDHARFLVHAAVTKELKAE